MSNLTEKDIQLLSEEVPKKVGEQIVVFRNQKKLTQTKLAEMVGKDRQYLYKIEKGKVTPSITTLAIISKALDISISELMKGV